MANKTQMVTIPLEEYRELLLKDKPVGSNDTVIIERLIEQITNNLKYEESTYYSNYIGDNMAIKDDKKIIKEFINMLKYVDFDRYMTIWNKVMTIHRKDEEMKAKIEQMNQAKEIRKGVEKDV